MCLLTSFFWLMSTFSISVSSSSEQNVGLLSTDELSNVGSRSGHGLSSDLAKSHGSDSRNHDVSALPTYFEVVILRLGGDSSTSNPANQT